MILFLGDNDTKICHASNIFIYQSYHEMTKWDKTFCNCLPACTSVEYNANIDRVEFNMTATRNISRNQIYDKG